MSNNSAQRLFYVVKESDKAYSLYSIHTDHLILAEVTSNVISDFLFLNEPTNPAYNQLESSSYMPTEAQINSDYNSYLIPEESGLKTYFELADRCSELVSYHMDYSDLSLADSWNITLSNLNVTQNPKQLEFDFGKEYELEVEKILNQFSDNPNNLKAAHKAASLLNTSVTKRIINESNRPSNLDDTQNPKAQSGQNSEWKDLIIDND